MEEPPEYDEAIARGSDRRRGCLNRSRKPAPMMLGEPASIEGIWRSYQAVAS